MIKNITKEQILSFNRNENLLYELKHGNGEVDYTAHLKDNCYYMFYKNELLIAILFFRDYYKVIVEPYRKLDDNEMSSIAIDILEHYNEHVDNRVAGVIILAIFFILIKML